MRELDEPFSPYKQRYFIHQIYELQLYNKFYLLLYETVYIVLLIRLFLEKGEKKSEEMTQDLEDLIY